MKNFTIFITEYLVKDVTVKAEDYDEAMAKVKEMYSNGDVVLSADDYVDTDFDHDMLEPEEIDMDGMNYCVRHGDNANVWEEFFETEREAMDYFEQECVDTFRDYDKPYHFNTLRIRGDFVELHEVRDIGYDDDEPFMLASDDIESYTAESYREHMRELEDIE